MDPGLCIPPGVSLAMASNDTMKYAIPDEVGYHIHEGIADFLGRRDTPSSAPLQPKRRPGPTSSDTESTALPSRSSDEQRREVATILACAYLRLLTRRHICPTRRELRPRADSPGMADIPLDSKGKVIAVRGVADGQP